MLQRLYTTSRIVLVIAALCTLSILSPVKSDENAKPTELTKEQKETVRNLIQDFESADFTVREQASLALREFGAGAIAPLNQALEDGASLDASIRIRRVIEAIKLAELLKAPVDLEKIFKEVEKAVDGDLDQEKLGTMLDKLTALLRKNTGNDALVLPVTFKDVREGDDRKNNLYIGDNIKVTSLSNCIVLAGESARFTSATNSIIICRGDVKITASKNCIVLAGGVSQTTSIAGGVALAGEATNATSAQDAVVGATGSTKFTSIRGDSVLVNSPPNERASRGGIRNLEVKSLFLPASSSNSL